MSEQLTQRELQVLGALSRHDGTAAVARELGIARATVRAHRDNAYRKLDVHSQRQAWIALGWFRER